MPVVVCDDFGDDRGWPRTRSAELTDPVLGPTWRTVHADYVTLADTKGIQIVIKCFI